MANPTDKNIGLDKTKKPQNLNQDINKLKEKSKGFGKEENLKK